MRERPLLCELTEGIGRRRVRGLRGRAGGGAFAVLMALSSASAGAQTPGGPALFPRPFVVEHRVTHTDRDGATTNTASVTDTYGGAWIVSVRPDSSRTIVDFARREITEVHPGAATYTTLSFDRFSELQRRLQRADEQTIARTAEPDKSAAAAPITPPEFAFEDLPAQEPARARSAQGDMPGAALCARPGVRHLRASVKSKAGADAAAAGAGGGVEVWLDPAIRLEPAARAALTQFETEVLGAARASREVAPARLIAAAREHAGGALAIRTVHAVSASATADGAHAATVEDVATKLETLEKFPLDLLAIPDGYRRVPHPLETMVAFLEDEAARVQRSMTTKNR